MITFPASVYAPYTALISQAGQLNVTVYTPSFSDSTPTSPARSYSLPGQLLWPCFCPYHPIPLHTHTNTHSRPTPYPAATVTFIEHESHQVFPMVETLRTGFSSVLSYC